MKKFLLLLVAIPLFLLTKGQAVARLGPNYFLAGLNTNAFNYYRISGAGNQHRDMWCWAACAQMCLNYLGLVVTQEQIVERCFGSEEDAPGGDREMFLALSGQAPNVWGRSSTIYSDKISIDANQIQATLANNIPMVVLLNNYGSNVGHDNVITGIYYSVQTDYYGNVIGIIPDKVVLRDPFPTSQSRNIVTWNDFYNRANTIYRVWVTYD